MLVARFGRFALASEPFDFGLLWAGKVCGRGRSDARSVCHDQLTER